MNTFIINYNGNKYIESKKLIPLVDLSSYDIIIEPFCGIFGFSRRCYEMGFRGQILLNDIDSNLIDTLNRLKDDSIKFIGELINEFDKYKCDVDITSDINKSYALGNISRTMSIRLCKRSQFISKTTNYLLKLDKYKELYKHITFYNMDAIKFIDDVIKNNIDKKILIFFDPPYFNSSNDQYQQYILRNDGEYHDGTKLYLDIMKSFNNYNVDQLMVLNHISIIDHMFNKFKIDGIFKDGCYQNVSKNIKRHNVYIKLT